ncbi:MAG: hypothetical protein ACYDD5_00165 [Sulfuricurvum sp.]
MPQPLFRQLGNKSVPKLLEKINYTDIVNTFAGGTGAPASAEVAKTLFNQINAETSSRINGDLAIIGTASADYSTLGKIETVIASLVTSSSADLTDAVAILNASIATEATARTSADNAITAALNQEIATRTLADTDEIAARTSADNSIIASVTQEVLDRTGADDAEALIRLTNDNALQANIDTEASTRASAIITEAAARTASDTMLDGKITNETNERLAADTYITGQLTNETTARVNADQAHDDRLSLIESGYVTGAKLKGTVPTVADLDLLVEADQQAGWFYVVLSGTTNTRDVYMVADGTAGADYIPTGWTAKSFIWLMDFNDVSNAVQAEKTLRIVADAEIVNSVTLLDSKVDSNKVLSDNANATIINDYTNADAAITTALNGEALTRLTADNAESAARIAADNTIQANLDAEIAAREAAITLEASSRAAADTVLQGNIDAEVLARETAVTVETNARNAADLTLQDNINTEIASRQAADTAEVLARSTADSALSARVDVFEGNETVTGSIKKALYDAKVYADEYIPIPNLEGTDGTLLVVGDTVTLTYAPHRGLNGIALGECIVYLANGDSVMVTVLNVVGNVVTLATTIAGEYAGLAVKIQYWFINADQLGAGMGVAGEGGAGL